MTRCSIIIPAYNSAETLDACLESARGQSERDIEIIAVDDGSPDATRIVIAAHAARDRRLIMLVNETNAGKSAAMNRAQEIASGDWIAVLDADDTFMPDRVAVLTAAGDRHSVDIVADDQMTYDPFLRSAEGRLFGIDQDFELDLHTFVDSIKNRHNYGMLKPVVRREFLRSSEVTYNVKGFMEDFYFLLELLLGGASMLVVSDALYNYTYPFSRRKKAWTHTGRGAWRYDFASAIETNERYLRDERVRRHSHVVAMLRRRSGLLRKNAQWSAWTKATLGGGVIASCKHALAHPAIFALICEKAIHGRLRA